MAEVGEAPPVDLATAVYGTITVGALLAADSAAHETYAETAGAVALAMVLYWVAHAYSQFASWRFQNREGVTLGRFGHHLVHEVPLLGGAAVPLLVLLVCWAAQAALADALTAAVWTSAGMIAVIEVAAGVRAHETPRELIAQTALGVGLGLMVVALKLLLHG